MKYVFKAIPLPLQIFIHSYRYLHQKLSPDFDLLLVSEVMFLKKYSWDVVLQDLLNECKESIHI